MGGRRTSRGFVTELKRGQVCKDCGGLFPPCALDFDHLDPKTKLANVAHMMSHRRDALLAEIAKCDLVCANCHRVRTHARRKGCDIEVVLAGKKAGMQFVTRARNTPCGPSGEQNIGQLNFDFCT